MWVTKQRSVYTQTVANPSCSTKGMCTLQSALNERSLHRRPLRHQGQSEDVVPASKEGNPPPKGGNPLKAEKNEPVPRLRLPRGPLRFPKKSSNGSSKKKQKCLVKP